MPAKDLMRLPYPQRPKREWPSWLTTLTDIAKGLLPPPDQFAINARQRDLLAQCASALTQAAEADDWLITAEHLRQARLALDALTGRAHTEDLLDTLFGRFCVGK